ncbi:MAG: hypothetical protein OIF58_15715 [Cohaesibacter sp.]|nr:hypothetical protein [Cohaesibacter sp.]
MKKIDFHIHTISREQDAAFEFSQSKLDEYIKSADLDGIAIVNHNFFSKSQFVSIRNGVSIPVFPGIEVDLEKGQILVFSDGNDLDSFEARCNQLTEKYEEVGDAISFEDFEAILGDLNQYILIPHYDKKPSIRNWTLEKLRPFVTAGEVSSAKKFIYCHKNADSLVPVYFSDCRIKASLKSLPTRQTFIDCDEITFGAVKACLKDKSKVSLSKEDGNNLFQVFDNGQHISTGLNVIVGDRSSGKSHTLNAIKKSFPDAYHIKQFALVSRDDREDETKFNSYLNKEQGLFSQNFLSSLQHVIEDVFHVNLEEDEIRVDKYVSSLLDYAKETQRHDTFSKAKIFSDEPFLDQNQNGLKDLIASTKNLISNVEFKSVIDKNIDREGLKSLYVELMNIYAQREELRKKQIWVNELTRDIKSKLQLRSAAPRINDVDLYSVALNRKKIEKFEALAKQAQSPQTPLTRSKRAFTVVANVGPFMQARELSTTLKRKIAFSDAYKVYNKPYKYLQELKKIGDPINVDDFAKLFVKIDFRILNKDGYDASGGERSEFFLLDEIEGAEDHEMLLIDEPESSFDNNFLKDDVNATIKEISRKMPVVVVTHNNTVGASIKPDYLICTRKEIKNGEVVWKTYSGSPANKLLRAPDKTEISTWDVLMGNLEAGSEAYEERKQTYENLKN